MPTVKDLKKIAKARGLKKYSKLRKAQLIKLINIKIDAIDKSITALKATKTRKGARKNTKPKRKTKAQKEAERIQALPIRKQGDPLTISLKKPQKHQKEFVENFINTDKVRGAMAVHGVGSGKTLTAVLTAEKFLEKFPRRRVIIITPASLLAGFKQELYTFDPAIEKDNRYSFFTYDGFVNAIKKKDSNADCNGNLLIVDEAQNLRTTINVISDIDIDEEISGIKATNTLEIKSGRKVYTILMKCARLAEKVMLLSATPIVNKIEDVENLMSMINGLEPLDPKSGIFDQILAHPENMIRYFGCRLSFFEHDAATRSKVFPAMTEKYIPIVMNPATLKEYNSVSNANPDQRIRDELSIFSEKKYINSFYIGVRKATNALGGKNSQKINWIMDWLNGVKNQKPDLKIGLTKKILDTHSDKTVIFTHFKATGGDLIAQRLKESGIPYGIVSGSVSKPNRQKIVDSYVKGDIKVILISKAGAEGLNLLETGYIIIVEPSWNNTEQEQVKGRGVRFMSHINLPKEKQNVLVLDLFLIRPSEKVRFDKTIAKILKGITKEQRKKNEEEYKELTKRHLNMLKYMVAKKDSTDPKIIGGSWNLQRFWTNETKKTKLPLTVENLDKLLRPIDKKEKIVDKSSAKYKKQQKKKMEKAKKDFEEKGKISIFQAQVYDLALKKFNIDIVPQRSYRVFLEQKQSHDMNDVSGFSIDVLLFAISNLKQNSINYYIDLLKDIDPLERCRYDKDLLDPAALFDVQPDKDVPPLNKWLKKFYDTDWKVDIEPDEKSDISMHKLRLGMTALTRALFSGKKDFVRLQNAFFTPPPIAEDMIMFSGINSTKHPIKMLEPTAGAGFITYEALISNPKIYCDSLEAIKSLRVFLDKFPRNAALPQNNFFDLPNSKKYRVIIMNPPYKLKAGLGLKRVSHDVDFVLKAFNDHLEDEGVLVCLITNKFEFRGVSAARAADKRIFEPFRQLLANNEHEIIKYEDGFKRSEGAVIAEMETGVNLRMVRIIKKKKS